MEYICLHVYSCVVNGNQPTIDKTTETLHIKKERDKREQIAILRLGHKIDNYGWIEVKN